MPYRPTDPLTDPPRQADELRRLRLERNNSGTTIWLWVLGMGAGIIMVALGLGSNRLTPPSSSPTTIGAAPTSAAKPPLAPTPAPASPATDNR
jgi:hypothetical protein